jgi:hypothetical protein
MNNFNIKEAKYTVSGLGGLYLSEALKLWKTKYPSFTHFKRATIKTPYLEEFGNFVEELWDAVEKITIKEAFSQTNAEKRRVYFLCIGVSNIFKDLNPNLLDRQVIKKKRTRWDSNNDPYEYEFEDVYELYGIPVEKIFKNSDSTSGRLSGRSIITAVRCWCTTTNREYWIYVPEEECLVNRAQRWNTTHKKKYDAIKGIAWTIRIDTSEPEKIYRQGDIIVVKVGKRSKQIDWHHLTKEEYLDLMYSES